MKTAQYLLTCLCSCIFFINSFAQEVIYTNNESFDLRTDDFSVIGKSGNITYVYRGTSKGFFLDAYNDSMIKTATVILDFFPEKIYETRFINYTDQLIVLYQAVVRNKVIQYVALLDSRGKLLKDPVKLTEEKVGIFGPNGNYFSSAVSDDKSQILVYGIEHKGRTIQFTGVWMDKELNISGRSHAAYTAENIVATGEGDIDNEGHFYINAYTPIGNKNYADVYGILSLPKLGTHFKIAPLKIREKYITNTHLKLDNINDKIYVAGFYTDKKNGSYDGVVYATYNRITKDFENQKIIAFGENIRQATGQRNAKKAFDNYYAKDIIIKKDGGFVLIAEDISITYRTNNMGWGGYYSFYYTPMMGRTVKEYYYDDILALSYDGAGNNEWYSFIRKSQYSQEDGGIFSSYALINTGGMLGFLFNDFNRSLSKIQFATLNVNGDVEMRSLAAGTTSDPDWLPRSAKQIGVRELIVPCLRRKQICFAKVVF